MPVELPDLRMEHSWRKAPTVGAACHINSAGIIFSSHPSHYGEDLLNLVRYPQDYMHPF